LQATTDCPNAWKATGHTVLGRGLFGGKPADFVHGLLGDVRVYDRALTAAQIKTLYTQGPQAGWQFDQTPGGAADTPDQWQLQGGAQFQSGQADSLPSGPLNLSGTGAFADVGRAALDTTRSYTVSAWVSLTSADGYQTLVSQDGKTLSGFFLQKRGADKFAMVIQSADDPAAPLAAAVSSFAPKANTLYHVVGVFRTGPIAAPPPPAAPPTPPAPILTSSLPWDAGKQGQFVESLAQDRQGHTWVATEDQGVWRYDPASPAGQRWTQFTTKDGLGSDDVYALLVDSQSRVWAGTLHGVSVYDGKTWKTYGPLEGLGGFRVFALASCPTNGDVWIATEGGLTRYLGKTGRWQQYSRLNGLPSDAVQCLAFSKTGDLYVGTQCDGIAIASPQNNYKTWRTVRGPASLPETGGGIGLPTSLINCLYVAHDGTVYAGTTTGLARSPDGGKMWRFLRGADWLEKRDGQHPQSWLDGGLVNLANVRAIEVLPQSGSPVRLAVGGPGGGGWQADHGFVGGQSFHTGDAIDSSAVEGPAPQSVYQYGRFGSFVYTIPNLKPCVSCRVRLHLADVDFDKPGQRVFNVGVNGKRVLTHEDIVAEAGAKDKVIVKEFTASADAQGQVVLSFRGVPPLPSLDKHSPYELSEDYVTALAEDGAGHLLIGHRQKGVEVLDPATGKRIIPKAAASPAVDFVTSLLPRPDGTLLVSGYGAGLSQMPIIGTTHDGVFAQAADASPAALPLPEPPPTLAELNAMLKTVSAVAPDKNELVPKVVALDDDWLTEGDWLGRYGRYWACLNAICSPQDYQWGAGWETVSYLSQIGPHAAADDGLRYWVQWLYTQDPRVLEMPPTYLDSRVKKGLTTPDNNRREAEQDDHGEAYPQSMEGPNVYTTLRIPSGLFTLSLYDVNYNGHGGNLRNRDYRVSIRPHPGASALDDISSFNQQPELAHERIQSFYGGVWKRFLVQGPQALTIEINRNNSFNAILPAVMLDLADEAPPPYFETVDQWENVQTHQEEQRQQALSRGYIALFQPCRTELEAADRLLDGLSQAQVANSSWWSANSRQFYGPLLRWYTQSAGHTPKEQQASIKKGLATCCYQMGQYQTWEEVQKSSGLTPARDVEKALRWNGYSSCSGLGYAILTSSRHMEDTQSNNTKALLTH